MSTTVQQLLDAAYNRSTKNRPGKLMVDATEGLQLVIRATRGLYSYAARVNPIFYGASQAVAQNAGTWARPAAAESIYRVEIASTNAEVAVVPYDDRAAEPSMPAVYEFGQKFFSAGNVGDPGIVDLLFWYSKRPTDPANLTAAIDATWPEQFNDLLILEVAIYMAIKDGRLDELGVFRSERDDWAKLYTAFLEHATANLRARFNLVRRFTTQTIVPLRSLLAGEGQ